MKLEVKALCNECKDCTMLEVKKTIEWAGNKPFYIEYACAHLIECKEVKRILEKQNESNIGN